MDAPRTAPAAQELTQVERTSDREMVVTRRLAAPARLVFAAWTRPELMQRWWVPASFGITLLSCEIDARTGGSYRFVFAVPGSEQSMAFFGTYLEVIEGARLVWTNEESDEGQVSTVTFEERDGVTLVTLHELYPSKAALDEAIASGSTGAWPEQFEALDLLLAGTEVR
jgi:uncharacterized protein YndB with AHSA1/START domain